MSEFLDQQNKQAFQLLREEYNLVPSKGEYPLLVLVSKALDDQNLSLKLPPRSGEPSPAQWERWSVLWERSPRLLVKELEKLMLREESPVPEKEDLPEWAASLVVLVLDELDLYLPV